ncbi:hypothetical protein ACUIJN_08695 [Metabacillus halosaccharovorans]|uniref:hypothetical protein n=1 Tax=Metabacillus halosaccharovorans TaxID=930124 RepID=UPI00403DA633
MYNVDFTIGEHCFRTITSSPLFATMINSSFCKVPENRSTPDMIIYVKDDYGVKFTNYEVKTVKEHEYLTFKRSDYLIEIRDKFKFVLINAYDTFSLKHALMNLYSSYIVEKQWGVLIHSSCVIDKEKAHIFSGHSGAGKSTAALLSSPRPLLSDEATIVKIQENDIRIYNSPFRSELGSTREETCCSLSSIQILFKDETNKRQQLSKSDALLELMDKIFYWRINSEDTKKVLILIKNLVELIPVYNLHFQKNNTFWELIS